MQFQPSEYEKKWLDQWKKDDVFTVTEDTSKKKAYVLDMFPYPSGTGLHVGHVKGYIATDVYSRMKRAQGCNVLHPMGWDAFGLPAENYAIKNKIHPRIAVEENIETFKNQLATIAFSYDWTREVDTTDPEFYRWSQWIFLQLLEKGLAYETYAPINWCPSCKTGLANEDLENGKCERCSSEIEKKPMRQWVLRITEYADRLLSDLPLVDWDENIKEMQRNWIGRSTGMLFTAPVKDMDLSIHTFSAHFEACYADTFVVIAPDHPLLATLLEGTPQASEVLAKCDEIIKKRATLERGKELEIDGIFTGRYIVDPLGNGELPIWVASYALADYGTGIVKCSAHDERDFAFAKKFGIDLKVVLVPEDESARQEVLDQEVCFSDMSQGVLLEPKELAGKNARAVREDVTKHLIAKGFATEQTQYRMKDWVFSRQRYWGEPIPVVHTEDGSIIPLAYEELPLMLPQVESYEPSGTGESPLATIDEWMNVRGYIDKAGKFKTIPNWDSFGIGDHEPLDINDGPYHDAYMSGAPIKERTNVCCIIKHPEHDEYLLAKWKQVDWNGFLTGGIEDHADLETTARNELIEETGFTSIRSIKITDFFSHGLFYHVIKKENRLAHHRLAIVELDSLEQVEVSEEEKAICDFVWTKKEEVMSTLSRPDMKSLWEYYLSGGVNQPRPVPVIPARRESNTMPQWAGSSWYYLRYIDPKNSEKLVDLEKEKYWMNIDVYVGGVEHATRHLIYARFWHKFLYDLGSVSTIEPFNKLYGVGLILGADGRKMSKRWGNVIDPQTIVDTYGADTLRVYEMFMGPFEDSIAWDPQSIEGSSRFLKKIWAYYQGLIESGKISDKADEKDLTHVYAKAVKKVTDDIGSFRFNTAISHMMIFLGELTKRETISRRVAEGFLKLLAPFAPCMTEELWHQIGKTSYILDESWPTYEEAELVSSSTTYAVQVNGKLRDSLELATGMEQDEVFARAKESDNVSKWLVEGEIKKVIFVQDRLINIVVA